MENKRVPEHLIYDVLSKWVAQPMPHNTQLLTHAGLLIAGDEVGSELQQSIRKPESAASHRAESH